MYYNKVSKNAHSDWLKQRAYQRTEHGLVTVNWLSNFGFGILSNLTQIKLPV